MINTLKHHYKSLQANPLKSTNIRILCIYLFFTFSCGASFFHEINKNTIDSNKINSIPAISVNDKFESLFYSHSKPYIEEVSFFGQVRRKLSFTGKSLGYKDLTIGWEANEVESYLNEFLNHGNNRSELKSHDIGTFFTHSLKSY